MRGEILFSEMAAVDMGVYLRCGDIGMTEQLLYHTQVRPSLKEMGGETVAKRMRMQPIDVCPSTVIRDDIEDALARYAAAPPVEKNGDALRRRADAFGTQQFTCCFEIRLKCPVCCTAQRNNALPIPFADYPQIAFFKQHCSPVEADDLADSQATAIENLEDCLIPYADGCRGEALIEKPVDLRDAERVRQSGGNTGQTQRGGGIGNDKPLVYTETVKTLERRNKAFDRSGGGGTFPLLQCGEIVRYLLALNLIDFAKASIVEPPEVAPDITPIGFNRQFGGPSLDGQIGQKLVKHFERGSI
jgi:hypothetical protein